MITGTVTADPRDNPNANLALLVEYDVSNNPIYVGEAQPGTAEDASGWRIKEITYDGRNNPTVINWAEGTRDFNKVWDDRHTYIYS